MILPGQSSYTMIVDAEKNVHLKIGLRTAAPRLRFENASMVQCVGSLGNVVHLCQRLEKRGSLPLARRASLGTKKVTFPVVASSARTPQTCPGCSSGVRLQPCRNLVQ